MEVKHITFCTRSHWIDQLSLRFVGLLPESLKYGEYKLATRHVDGMLWFSIRLFYSSCSVVFTSYVVTELQIIFKKYLLSKQTNPCSIEILY